VGVETLSWTVVRVDRVMWWPFWHFGESASWKKAFDLGDGGVGRSLWAWG
jgi:hypothetical protein